MAQNPAPTSAPKPPFPSSRSMLKPTSPMKKHLYSPRATVQHKSKKEGLRKWRPNLPPESHPLIPDAGRWSRDSLGDHVIQRLIADSVVTSLECVMLCCVLLATFYTIESQKVCIALLCSLTKTVLTCCTRTPSHIPYPNCTLSDMRSPH